MAKAVVKSCSLSMISTTTSEAFCACCSAIVDEYVWCFGVCSRRKTGDCQQALRLEVGRWGRAMLPDLTLGTWHLSSHKHNNLSTRSINLDGTKIIEKSNTKDATRELPIGLNLLDQLSAQPCHLSKNASLVDLGNNLLSLLDRHRRIRKINLPRPGSSDRTPQTSNGSAASSAIEQC
ncbi:hypothetical protein KCV07_g491, partial [Aureobasidium melanogenum]